MPMDWQLANIPLAAGMQQKADPRAMEAPALEVCLNAEFDEVGGIQKRKPYAALAGTAPSDIRRLAVYDGELLAFTVDGIYSYSSANSTWELRASYPAPTVAEESVFVRLAEQTECERAELSGVAWYAWSESGGVWLAALDTATGAVLMSPTEMDADANMPRLCALSAKVLMFYHDVSTNDLWGRVLDPADPDNPGSPSSIHNSTSHYDVEPLNTTQCVIAHRVTSGGYIVRKVSDTLSTVTSSSKARTIDSMIALSISGSSIAIIRSNGTGIKGDIVNQSTLIDRGTVDLAVGTATGTPINQLAVAGVRNPGDDQSTYHVFWTAEKATDDSDFMTEKNTITVFDDLSPHSVATEGLFVRRACIGSRAFVYDDGSFEVPYIWMSFAGESGATNPDLKSQLQNTYLLYDTNGTLHGKAIAATAGGFTTDGHLPNVQSLGSGAFAFAGVVRRVIPLAEDQSGYSARSPASVTVTFDSDAARRVVALGKTLYIAGAQLLQYDGEGVAEVGFHIYPWYFIPVGVFGAASGGSIDITTSPGNLYAYLNSWRYDNAKGERERSTTATVEVGYGSDATETVGRFDITVMPLHTTRKTGVSVEYWRSAKNPLSDSPYYIVTDQDPDNTALTLNEFILNDPTADWLGTLGDGLADANLIKREPWPENGGVLENLAPPPATILAVTQDRLFLAGLANAPHRIAYSRLRGEGEIASFNDALQVDLPPDGGAITALAFLNETLVVFKERAIYMLPGDGFDNVGGGQNYGPARLVATDVGAQSAESVAVTPEGIIFRSDKGWYRLTRGWGVEYIGAPVSDYDSDTIVAIHVLEGQHQVRVVSTARILMYDTLVQQWSEWEESGCVGAVMWGGQHVIATSSSVLQQQTSHATTDYALDVETAWMKTAGLQGYQRGRSVSVLGEDQGLDTLRIRVARDYEMSSGSPSWFDDKPWSPPASNVSGGPLNLKHRASRQKCAAMKVRITDGGSPASLVLDDDLGQYSQVGYDSAMAITTKATWEGWFKLSESLTSHYLFAQVGIYELYLVTPAYTMTIDLGSSVATSGTLSYSLGTWHHIAVVYDGTQATAADRVKFYFDGVDTALGFTADPPTTLAATSNPLLLGASDTGSADFDGKMFDLRMWNVARSASEVADNRSTILRPTSGLVVNTYRQAFHKDLSGNRLAVSASGSPTPSFDTADLPFTYVHGEGMKLTGLALEYGIKRGPMRLPATKRQ